MKKAGKAKSDLSDLSQLKPANYNPRKISDKAAAGLKKSIKKFGDISGIVWNKRTGNLVCGHQRMDRLKEIGAKLQDGQIVTPAGECFNVRVVDWDIATEKTANVTANNKAISGAFTGELEELLGDIESIIGEEDFTDLRLDELTKEAGEADIVEWSDDTVEAAGVFIFRAPIEYQAKIRAILKKEFPGLSFDEETIYG